MTDPDHELREVGGFACPAGFFHLFFTRYKVGGGGGGGGGEAVEGPCTVNCSLIYVNFLYIVWRALM